MKFIYSIVIVLFLLVSCQSNEENPVAENKVESIAQDSLINPPPTYHSNIREGEEITVDKIYIDTLVFHYFNEYPDYMYGVFISKNNDSIAMVFNEFIEETHSGKSIIAKWHLDSLYEAGEGDELYFQERLVSYEIVQGSKGNFEKFLQTFVVDFVDSNSSMLSYLNAESQFQSSYNIGLYCTLSKMDSVDKRDWFQDFNTSIYDFSPIGDFCEGYSGVEDGFYYESIFEEDFPDFDNMNEEESPIEKYEIPGSNSYLPPPFIKVTIIKNEHHGGQLFFIKLKNKWYFFAQDLCDCSA